MATGGRPTSPHAPGWLTVPWRVALIDSCGHWPGAADAAAFVSAGEKVERRATVADRSGHGSRIAQVLLGDSHGVELLLGQVFLSETPASAACVAAAIDWAGARGAELIHMSLGLGADRAVLAGAVRRAIASSCMIVASMPARGAPVYPAAYPDVIRATGDARCAPGEISCLGPSFFGGCPRFEASGDGSAAGGTSDGATSDGATRGGASVGAAWVTRSILCGPKDARAADVVAALAARVRYVGREQRGRAPTSPC
jgi:hypothetical protein